jgi:hypothetical protein
MEKKMEKEEDRRRKKVKIRKGGTKRKEGKSRYSTTLRHSFVVL